MNARDYCYAQLGNACQTSADTLISNTKYLPMDSSVYNVFPTKTLVYPGVINSIPVGYGQAPAKMGSTDTTRDTDLENPDEKTMNGYEGYSKRNRFALPSGCKACKGM